MNSSTMKVHLIYLVLYPFILAFTILTLLVAIGESLSRAAWYALVCGCFVGFGTLFVFFVSVILPSATKDAGQPDSSIARTVNAQNEAIRQLGSNLEAIAAKIPGMVAVPAPAEIKREESGPGGGL